MAALGNDWKPAVAVLTYEQRVESFRIYRAPLPAAHAHLAVRPEHYARKLFERLRESTVLVSRLVEQAATIERIRRRAKRRRNFRAGLIQAGSGSCVIRRGGLLGSASGEGDRRAHHDHLSHAVNLGPAVDRFKRRRSWHRPNVAMAGP
jgi:hypothetical protein